MKQSLVIHKILSLNKSLHRLNANNKYLKDYLKNPAFDFLQTKIMFKHANLNEYFSSYSGMLLYKIDSESSNDKHLNTKEQRLRQHERLLVEIKTEALLIEKHIIASVKFKEVFAKLYKLCSKQLAVVQQEISLLLTAYPKEIKNSKQKMETPFH